MNLTLYAVNAFIVLDTDGHRVLAKYYSPKGRMHLGDSDPNKGLHGLKEQRAFEKGLFSKTKKPGGASAVQLSRLRSYSFYLPQAISFCTTDIWRCTDTRWTSYSTSLEARRRTN